MGLLGEFAGGFKALGSTIHDAGSSLFGHPGSAQRDEALKGKGKGYLAADPYQSGWDALISQLQERAAGKNSLAERQTRDVAAAGMNQQASMGAGRSAGAARRAGLGAAKITQGLENSAGEARLAEMNQAEGALQGALGGADSATFNRDRANQEFFGQTLHDSMNQPSTLQQAASVFGSVASAAGGAGAFGGAKPSAAQAQPQSGMLQHEAPNAMNNGQGTMQSAMASPSYDDMMRNRFQNNGASPYNDFGIGDSTSRRNPYGPQY